ncbi:conserved hypothetical protein [Vibrio crassostreae]|uniref:hypothetical protein n=1 Tax=Vibrio lentus TaxID=136468 RepID=UPI0018E4A2A2|nr:hypothetical protein [Vibrio lentus]CAK1839780.1 conserved hypothetical protein [Vibrio crassostreae]CAK1991193.1 conserved hypothetical protein [Vibrio crassostreae]CAK1996142.1 conserved hypothetical protein [Vibrio crassostreae]CAK2004093.1 conserved hypothetical protein [Vibrio crassostreae]CAK2024661.1 conserved hypothetical protein [Vibrio crassostreae]
MLNFLLGRSSFSKKEQVIESIRSFEKFSNNENIENADALLLFKSDTQQCWLVFTNLRMYFVLNDTEKSLLKPMWARDKQNIVVRNRVQLHLKEEKHSKETGKLYFGNMNNGIFYTYSLFQSTSIAGIILALANKHFLPNQ